MNLSLGLCGLLVALIVTGLGCGASEADSALLPVHGTVSVDDRRAIGGSVSYHPEDPAIGVLPVGTIQSDGTYQVYVHGKPGAPEGNYRVTVFMHEKSSARGGHAGLPTSIIDPRYNAQHRTPLSVAVHRDARPGHYDLKIVTQSEDRR